MRPRFFMASGKAVPIAATLALVCLTASADARVRHRARHHFREGPVQPLHVEPRPETLGEQAAYGIAAFSGLFTQGIGGATDALPAQSYPSGYGALNPAYRGPAYGTPAY